MRKKSNFERKKEEKEKYKKEIKEEINEEKAEEEREDIEVWKNKSFSVNNAWGDNKEEQKEGEKEVEQGNSKSILFNFRSNAS